MTKKTIMALIVLISMAGLASAGSTLTLPVGIKDVKIGDPIGTDFEVILNTSHAGSGVISWDTSESFVQASMDGEPFSNSGHIDVDTQKDREQAHTLTVRLTSGATIGEEYGVFLNYCYGERGGSAQCQGNAAKAKAEATVNPTPELSTSILTATGLIGLVGLVRLRRKN